MVEGGLRQSICRKEDPSASNRLPDDARTDNPTGYRLLRLEKLSAPGLDGRRGRIGRLYGKDHPVARTIGLARIGGNQTYRAGNRRSQGIAALNRSTANAIMLRENRAESIAWI